MQRWVSGVQNEMEEPEEEALRGITTAVFPDSARLSCSVYRTCKSVVVHIVSGSIICGRHNLHLEPNH